MRCAPWLAAAVGGAAAITTLLTMAVGVDAGGTQCDTTGADVIVGVIPNVSNYSSSGGIEAFAIGTTSCNIGDVELLWISNSTQHPVIGQNLYRLHDGTFEQIGQAWLKHGFTALQGNSCGCGCQAWPNGTRLGVGCSDPYSSGLNGSQSGMGPKFEVNAYNGAFNWPPFNFNNTGNSVYKRLQAAISDLGSGSYYVEAQYVAPDDSAAGNQFNNVSWRPATISGGGSSWSMSLTGSTVREQPAIEAWAAADGTVTLEQADVPGEGRFYLGWKATDVGGGNWSYDFALYNMNSDRSARSVTIPLPGGNSVNANSFHDVDYHSGEPWDGTDWTPAPTSSSMSWSTDTFGSNPNANAIRWGTMYNFRFTADVSPSELTEVEVGLFKPGTPTSITIPLVPTAPANDDCGSAISVGAGNVSFNSSLASTDGPVEACGDIGSDIWYQHNATCTGDLTISTCGAGFDTQLAVYSSCPTGPGEALACSDDVCGSAAEITLPVTLGQSLLIRVGGAGGAQGSGTLAISCDGGPVDDNDLCAGAIEVADGTVPYDTTQAGTDGPIHGECQFDGQTYNDVWFYYNAPCDGDLLVTTCADLGGSSTYDTDLVVYDGCDCGNLVLAACNDDDGGNPCGGGPLYQSTVNVVVTQGNCYLIRVGGWSAGDLGTGELFIDGPDATDCGPDPEGACCFDDGSCSLLTSSACAKAGGTYQGDGSDCGTAECGGSAIPNDNCVDALPIATGDTAYSTVGANTDGPVHGACEFDGQTYSDIWYAYTADCTGDLTVSTCNQADYDTDLVIYDGCDCGSLSLLGCNDDTDGCAGFSSEVTVGVSAGDCYLIRVGGWNPGDEGTGTLSVTCDGPPIVDCNGNGVDDLFDIMSGTSQDCNANDIPDECDIADGTSVDCGGGPVGNATDGATIFGSLCFACHSADGSGGVGPDIRDYTRDQIWTWLLPPNMHSGGQHPEYSLQDWANLEAFLDQDGASGARPDMVPDECQTLADCDNDGDPDACELGAGTQTDSNYDGLPDDCFPLCQGDVNNDGVIDVSDLLAVLGAWGSCPGCPEDLNGDGAVDVTEVLLILGNWGPCP